MLVALFFAGVILTTSLFDGLLDCGAVSFREAFRETAKTVLDDLGEVNTSQSRSLNSLTDSRIHNASAIANGRKDPGCLFTLKNKSWGLQTRRMNTNKQENSITVCK